MATHELARVPRITGGAGARSAIADRAAGLVPAGASVLLVADPGLAPLGLTAEIAVILRSGGFAVAEFTDIKSDPTLQQTDAAARLAHRIGAGLVVALGGGSALDLGKAAASIEAMPEPMRRELRELGLL